MLFGVSWKIILSHVPESFAAGRPAGESSMWLSSIHLRPDLAIRGNLQASHFVLLQFPAEGQLRDCGHSEFGFP
jgi:hypothetical protein